MYRRTLGKSKINNIHRFKSFKNPSTILAESCLEFDACYHPEYNQYVVYFESQPQGFEYVFENKVCRYTPDFLIRLLDGREIYIEVKPSRIANRKDFLNRFYCMREAARSLGRELLLWTEEIIRQKPYLDNLKVLHKYRTDTPLSQQHRDVLRAASHHSERDITIDELCTQSGIEKPQSLPLVYDLIARNELSLDLKSQALSNESVVGISHDYRSKIH